MVPMRDRWVSPAELLLQHVLLALREQVVAMRSLLEIGRQYVRRMQRDTCPDCESVHALMPDVRCQGGPRSALQNCSRRKHLPFD